MNSRIRVNNKPYADCDGLVKIKSNLDLHLYSYLWINLSTFLLRDTNFPYTRAMTNASKTLM